MSQNANRRNRHKPEPTAAEVYAARRADIARLLDVITMELEAHDAKAKAEPANWGLPGNLGKVRSDLVDLAGFLSNKDPEEVEAFLNDAE
jgi:hypothetical protein